MKKLTYILIPLLIFVFTGCLPKNNEVYANYMMPPKELTDISDIKNIKVQVNRISVNGLSSQAKNDIINMIKGKVSALTYQEQVLDIYDEVLMTKINKLSRASHNYHGYSKLHAQKEKFATLKVDVKVNLKRRTGTDRVSQRLKYQPYTVKYTKSKFPAPYSVPTNNPRYSTVTTNVDYIKYDIEADLNVRLYNTKRKIIYRKKFNNIKLSQKIGGDSKEATEMPTNLSLVSEALTEKLRAVIRDISPYKESRKLYVNEKGDPTVVALMKATAFSDAVYKLDEVITASEKSIEEDKKTLKSDYATKISEAKKDEDKTALKEELDEKIAALYTPLSADYENMGIINEIVGDLPTSKYFYSLALKADTLNANAKASVEKIDDILNKQKQLRNMTKKVKVKSTYKSKDNKDR